MSGAMEMPQPKECQPIGKRVGGYNEHKKAMNKNLRIGNQLDPVKGCDKLTV